VQGSGATTPIGGTAGVEVEAVVVGDFAGAAGLGGIHLQEEDADAGADSPTSEGLFIFLGGAALGFTPVPGDVVRGRGTAGDLASGSGSSLTELTALEGGWLRGSASVTPKAVTLPVVALADLERFEGMLVELPQEPTVTDTFALGRFGAVDLSVGGRLVVPTQQVPPGADALALAELQQRSRIVLDAGSSQ
jgi:predicted extracellular nuclease